VATRNRLSFVKRKSTPRAYDQVRFKETMPAKVPQVHQERAFTSPIWYSPA